MKLQVQRSRLDTRKYFFSQRVVQHWNSLPQRVVDATSVTSFSNIATSVTTIQDMGIKGFAYQAHQRQSQNMVSLGLVRVRVGLSISIRLLLCSTGSTHREDILLVYLLKNWAEYTHTKLTDK